MTGFNYEAMSNIAVSVATLNEYLDRFFQKKEDREIALSLLLTSTKKNIRKNEIEVNLKNSPQFLELYATWDITGKKSYPKMPDVVKISTESLAIMLIKSVTSADSETMTKLREKITQMQFAIKYIWFNEEWIDICLFELNQVYLECLAIDRQKYDTQLVESLQNLINYISNINSKLNLFDIKHNKFKKMKNFIIENEIDDENVSL